MNHPSQFESSLASPVETSQAAPVRWFGGLILLVAVPLFLRMPLTNDAVHYDLQVRMISEGSVPYRDVLEPNLPGVFWVHGAVRRLLGSSSEALRVFDLCCVILLGGVVRRLAQQAGSSRTGATCISLAMVVFYLGSTEWCHCQRDTWLLLPATAAIGLRMRRLSQEMSPKVSASAAFAEGCLWGIACWLKPYSALLAVAASAVTLPQWFARKQLAKDSGLVILGGLFMGVPGVAWLIQTGASPYWLETMREWNPRYLAAGRENWVWPRFVTMFWRMQPWYCLHLLAIPLALSELASWAGTLRHRPPPIASHPETVSRLTRCALAAAYLATLAHVFLLQHLFDYVHAPTVLLAIVVVGIWLAQPQRSRHWRWLTLAFGLLVAIQSPLLKPQRVRLWWACVTQPSSARLQDRLALLPNPHRVHLERVAEFLSEKTPTRTAVNVLNSDLVSLYARLDLRPPTRFVYMWELLLYFPRQREEIMAELENSGHRFVVSDLISCGMSPAAAWEIGPDGPHAPPPKYLASQVAKYPWSQPVVFRSGPYMVHEVRGPLGKPGSLTLPMKSVREP